MKDFKVKLGQMRTEADNLEQMTQSLADFQEDLTGIRNALRFRIAQRDRIEQKLNQQRQALESEKKKMASLAGNLTQIADMYEKTESALAGIDFHSKVQAVTGESAGGEAAGQGGESAEGESEKPWWEVKIGPQYEGSILEDGEYGDLGELINSKVNPDNPVYKALKKRADDFNDDVEAERSEKDYLKREIDFKNKTVTVTDTDLKDEDAVKEFDKSMDATDISTSVKLASIGGTIIDEAFWSEKACIGSKDGSHISAEMYVGHGEVELEAYAGLYQTDPVTGEKKLKPGIGAEAGASATAFSTEIEGQLGSDMLGLYANAEGTVGRLGAEAEISAGLYDKEGKFNPSLHGGASLEAIAAEATLAGGVKVLGTDVGVKGSVNVGIGAHADVGFADGKLMLDIGASVGVGGSVALEIDVSGTVDAVCDNAEAIWDGVTDVAETAWDGVTDAADSLKDGISSLASKLGL